MNNDYAQKSFRILSIDGGGIRGIIPARFLCELESQISHQKGESVHLCDYFDLICGTSTGGIIAIGLALGMSAGDVLKLYKDKATNIFGKPKAFRRLWQPKHSNEGLRKVLVDAFGDARLGNAKTRLCVPAFSLQTGKAVVFKTSHHPSLHTDYQIPAYQAALSTSAAPTYFTPFSGEYNLAGRTDKLSLVNHVDGGIYANNPTMIGILEAIYTLKVDMNQLKVLSLGTGTTPFNDSNQDRRWGIGYWANRIIDVAGQAQSHHIEGMVKYLCHGAANSNECRFLYERIQFELSKDEAVTLDATDIKKLDRLEKKVSPVVKEKLSGIEQNFFEHKKEDFIPFHKI